MAAKTPVRLNFDGSGNLDGFAEFQSADFVALADGGTGASPLSSIKHCGGPVELGLVESHRTLVENGLRERVVSLIGVLDAFDDVKESY